MGYSWAGEIQEFDTQLSKGCSLGVSSIRSFKYSWLYIDMSSAESISKWIDFIREAGKTDIKIYVIGNKSDLEAEISGETRKMAEEIASKEADKYKEVSAKTSANIEDLFSVIIEDLVSSFTKKK